MTRSILDINRRLAENPAAFIAEAEAAYDRQLSEIADHIAAHSEQCPVILLSGPSGSGKTTTALMLEHKLDRRGLETHTLSQDNYFRTQTPEDMALLAEGKFDLESPARVDEDLLNRQLRDIIDGKPVQLTEFDFRNHKQLVTDKVLTRQAGEVVILEGIHALNPAVVTLPEEQTVRLYVSVRTRVEGPHGEVLHPKYIRLLRRMIRDVQYRGRPAEGTLGMFHSVNRGEDHFIMPYKHRSTFDVDTFFGYELNLYRRYLMEELTKLAEHPEIREVLPVIEAAAPLEADLVPDTALVREFIGGSVYHG